VPLKGILAPRLGRSMSLINCNRFALLVPVERIKLPTFGLKTNIFETIMCICLRGAAVPPLRRRCSITFDVRFSSCPLLEQELTSFAVTHRARSAAHWRA
jgi:hypothetical protein